MCLIDGIVSVASFETLLQWLYHGEATFPIDLTVTEKITKIVEFARLCDMVGVTGMERRLAAYIKMVLQKEPLVADSQSNENDSDAAAASADPWIQGFRNTLRQLRSANQANVGNFPGSSHPGSSQAPAAQNPPTSRLRFPPSHHQQMSAPADLPHYTDHIISEHLHSASELPRDHPVRKTFASAVVAEYMDPKSGTFKFATEMEEIQTFALDVLEEVKETLGNDKMQRYLPGPTNRHVSFRDPITGAPIVFGTCGEKAERRHYSPYYSPPYHF